VDLFSRGRATFGQAEAAAWLAALESGRFAIPQNIHDSEAWDRYWSAQIEFGQMEQGFGDMMASSPDLIPTFAKRGVRSILCVGNGLSSESYALALHGFDVTALDVSAVPRAMFSAIMANQEHSLHRVPGFTPRGDAAVAFDGTAPISPELCPRMHQTDRYPPRQGGSLTYVTGDLIDMAHCPGPFDVVIERRTVQLFKAEERPSALERLALRLGPRGVLVSHEHQGAWRPGDARAHFASEWVREHGFANHPAGNDDSGERASHLLFTTG
jgi:hypothetical protein